MRNTKGETPLIVAAEHGHDTLCNMLLDYGAHVDEVDRNGDTALHHASAWGHLKVLRTLLRRNATFDLKNKAGFDAAAYSFTQASQTYFVSMVAELDAAQLQKKLPPPPPRPVVGDQRPRSNTGPAAMSRPI